MTNARISGLYCYPIKSARGQSLSQAVLAATGIEHDREWMLVDARGHFVTQREQPRLATLTVQVSTTDMTLSTPGCPSLHIEHSASVLTRRVRVWDDDVDAIDAGDDCAQWLSRWLGGVFRLVRFAPGAQRHSNVKWTRGQVAPNFFTDGYPLLVLSQASIDDLSRRVGRALPVERFRPNILLDGVDPYAEDRIEHLQIGKVRLRIVKPCTRCVITTTDQETGHRDGNEPLKTLKGYRYNAALKGVVFAQNAIIVAGIGESLRVGDRVITTAIQVD